MRKGFEAEKRYVIEERLSDGRLLCHCFGDEDNKRVVPLGVKLKNKLYLGMSPVIKSYDGVNFRPFAHSSLYCEVADESELLLTGMFDISGCVDDYLGFLVGQLYVVKSTDARNNLIVSNGRDDLIVPKGVIFHSNSRAEEQYVYDGYNLRFNVGDSIYCDEILDNLSFQCDLKDRNFVQMTDALRKNRDTEHLLCGKCGRRLYLKTTKDVSFIMDGIESTGRVDMYGCTSCDGRYDLLCIPGMEDRLILLDCSDK